MNTSVRDRASELPAVNYSVDRCQRVKVNLLTGCWRWTGPILCGIPYTHILKDGRTGLKAANYFYGVAFNKPKALRQKLINTCGSKDCVKPTHHRLGR